SGQAVPLRETKGKWRVKNSRLRLVFSLGFFAFGLAYSTAWGKPPKQTIHWGEFNLRWGGLSGSAPPFLAFLVGRERPAHGRCPP
ncbi:hypothetical protein, partial [Vibrio cholerae]|uniref:hypothetical protein n=1 Tax=Vibrio cholerae TaxID=666 RepID=UPI00209EBC49